MKNEKHSVLKKVTSGFVGASLGIPLVTSCITHVVNATNQSDTKSKIDCCIKRIHHEDKNVTNELQKLVNPIKNTTNRNAKTEFNKKQASEKHVSKMGNKIENLTEREIENICKASKIANDSEIQKLVAITKILQSVFNGSYGLDWAPITNGLQTSLDEAAELLLRSFPEQHLEISIAKGMLLRYERAISVKNLENAFDQETGKLKKTLTKSEIKKIRNANLGTLAIYGEEMFKASSKLSEFLTKAEQNCELKTSTQNILDPSAFINEISQKDYNKILDDIPDSVFEEMGMKKYGIPFKDISTGKNLLREMIRKELTKRKEKLKPKENKK